MLPRRRRAYNHPSSFSLRSSCTLRLRVVQNTKISFLQTQSNARLSRSQWHPQRSNVPSTFALYQLNILPQIHNIRLWLRRFSARSPRSYKTSRSRSSIENDARNPSRYKYASLRISRSMNHSRGFQRRTSPYLQCMLCSVFFCVPSSAFRICQFFILTPFVHTHTLAIEFTN